MQDTGNDSAYSNIALELHTDGAYMRDPPALQARISAKGSVSPQRHMLIACRTSLPAATNRL